MDAKKESKSLDALSDKIDQNEGGSEESSKNALSSLSEKTDVVAAKEKAEYDAKLRAVKVDKEDVKLIVSEMEVDDEEAEKALRVAGVDGGGVKEALRALVCA